MEFSLLIRCLRENQVACSTKRAIKGMGQVMDQGKTVKSSKAPGCLKSRRICGFTAMELLIVISIITMMLGLSGPLLKKLAQGNRMDMAVRIVQTAIRSAKSQAIKSSGTACLLPLDDRTLQVCLVTKTNVNVDSSIFGTGVNQFNNPYDTTHTGTDGGNTARLHVYETYCFPDVGTVFLGRQDLTNEYDYTCEYIGRGSDYLILDITTASSGFTALFSGGDFPAMTPAELRYLDHPVFVPVGNIFKLPTNVRLANWGNMVTTAWGNAVAAEYTWNNPAQTIAKKRLFGCDAVARTWGMIVKEEYNTLNYPNLNTLITIEKLIERSNTTDDFIIFNALGMVDDSRLGAVFFLLDETTLGVNGAMQAEVDMRAILINNGGNVSWMIYDLDQNNSGSYDNGDRLSSNEADPTFVVPAELFD